MSCSPTNKRNSPGWDREVPREPTAAEVARVWRGYGRDAALEKWKSFGERFLSDLVKSVPGSTETLPQRRLHTPEMEAEISGFCAEKGFKRTRERYGVTAGYLSNLMRRTNTRPPDTRTRAVRVPPGPIPKPVVSEIVADEDLVIAPPAHRKAARTNQLYLFMEAAE